MPKVALALVVFALLLRLGAEEQPKKERISDYKPPPTVIEIVKGLDDPIRADLESIMEKAVKHQSKEPDQLTARDMFGYIGAVHDSIKAAYLHKIGGLPEHLNPKDVEHQYMIAFKAVIELAKEKSRYLPSSTSRTC